MTMQPRSPRTERHGSYCELEPDCAAAVAEVAALRAELERLRAMIGLLQGELGHDMRCAVIDETDELDVDNCSACRILALNSASASTRRRRGGAAL